MARPNDDGKIVCTDCERELPGTVKYFHHHRDAFKPKCKECRGSSFGVSRPNRVIDTPNGQKICSKCRNLLPADKDHFYTSEKTSDGWTSACKKCRSGTDYGVHRPNRNSGYEDGHWYCKSCETLLPLNTDNFYRYNGEYEVYCKPCSTQKTNQRRRSLENDVVDDLTGHQWQFVKANWLKEGVVECAYCGTDATQPERDHVVPISDGGDTTARNIVPCCASCNRSKGIEHVSDWYPEQDFYTKDRWHRIQEHLQGDTTIPDG